MDEAGYNRPKWEIRVDAVPCSLRHTIQAKLVAAALPAVRAWLMANPHSNEREDFHALIFVWRPFPGPGGRWQISTGGGTVPLWSRDGREPLFETLDQRVMAASYTAKSDSFASSKPRVWAETRLRNIAFYPNYDLSPDGKRLAAVLADDASREKELTHLTFLLNFFDELRRRAPAGK